MSDELSFDDLKLLPGTKLDLRSEQYALLKGASHYIGCLTKKSIVVSTPMANGRPVSCSTGNSVVIRLYVNHLSCACAFRTQIIHTSVTPYPHLFLEIPDHVEIGAVRKSIRVNVNIIGFAKTDLLSKPQSIMINNLSTDGARLESKMFLGDNGDKIKITTRLKVLGVEHTVKVDGIIRSCSDPSQKEYYGVQFDNIDATAQLVLYAYVMSEISG
ncbi:MAG: flagellar brake domain-containing protein [Cellvibrionaceae bacterium]